MKAKKLAEAIILQSFEDLWDSKNRASSVEFFSGEGFRHCSDIACMSDTDKKRLLEMIGSVIVKTGKAQFIDTSIIARHRATLRRGFAGELSGVSR